MGKITEGRRYCRLEIPLKAEVVFAEIESPECVHFYNDEKQTEEIQKSKRYTLELEFPKEIKKMKIVRSILPPICSLVLNRKIWPKENMTGLRIILDNRNINLIDSEGNFRESKYQELYRNATWKRWAMLVYEGSDGEYKTELWWKLPKS